MTALALGPAAAAQDACLSGLLWRPPIGVVLQHQTAERLCVDRAVPCTTVTLFELQTTIEATLDEFFDRSGSRVRLEYQGLCFRDPPVNSLPCGDTDLPPGRIVIRAPACGAFGFGELFDPDGDGLADRGFAEICTLAKLDPPTPHLFSSFPGGDLEASSSVQGVLMHELSHAIGFEHPSDCGPAPGSSVLQGTRAHLAPFDINSLQDTYGRRERQSLATRIHSILAPGRWLEGPGSAEGAASLGRVDLCDHLVPGGALAAFTHAELRTIGILAHEMGEIRLRSVVPSFLPGNVVVTHASPAIACAGDGRVRTFFAREVNGRDQSIAFVDSADGGRTWGPPALADEFATSLHGGVDATFDPASGFFVYAHRDTTGVVVTQVMSPGSRVTGYPRPEDGSFCQLGGDETLQGTGPGGPVPEGTRDCWRASDTPSVACGAPSALGEHNCMLAWADTDWTRRLTYAPARVVALPGGGHRLELHDVRDGGFTVFGTPDLAVDRDRERPWWLVLHRGGHVAHTLRKAPDPEAAWEHGGELVFPAPITSVALGTTLVPIPFFPFPLALPFTVAYTLTAVEEP